MNYLALARKWRPKSFSEVIGQDHVVSALTNALNNQRVHHAFLFAGTRGVGKTTLARIFAKALNCETGISAEPCGECVVCRGVDQGNFIDLIEVDAASRTKVDDTRELLDNVQYTPTQGRFKIYLIDEVHMLSTHSFNALLKTLEEPPEHVKFLLATTNPQKLPTTILSRCIQFNLKSVEIGRLAEQLEKILEAEKIVYEINALMILARSANGSVRDSLSLLDQAIAFSNGDISAEKVRSMLGMIDDQLISQTLNQVIDGSSDAVLESVALMAERSADYATALDDLLSLIHNVSLYQISPQAVEWKGIDTDAIIELCEKADPETLQLLYQIAAMGKRDFNFAPDPRSGFEMVLIRMLAFKPKSLADMGSTNVPYGADEPNKQGGKGGVEKSVTTHNRQPPKTQPPKIRQPKTQPADNRYQIPERQSARIVSKSDAVADGGVNAGTVVDVIAEGNADVKANSNDDNRDAPPQEKTDKLASVARSESPAATREKTSGGQSDTISDLNQLINPQGWEKFIDQTGLNGICREILMNMAPKSVGGNTIHVVLDAGSRHIFNDRRCKQIEQHCLDALSLDVRFKVDIADLSETASDYETPTQKRDREQKKREAAARQVFIHDANVQELVDAFDAEIVGDSIRPG